MQFSLVKLEVKGYITTQMRKIKNYYFSVTDYIPATTLRGAILAEYYYQKGKLDLNFYASPAYPKDTLPAHYFSPATKRKGRCFAEVKGILSQKEKELDSGDIGKALKLEGEGKPKIGTLIRLVNANSECLDMREGVNYYEQYVPESSILMHVAIDKQTASSYHQMLFAYEYKKFGDQMWTLTSSDSEVIDVINKSYIKVGRGKSRAGSLVRVEKVKDITFDEPKGLSYCLSPCIPLLFGKEFFKVKTINGTQLIIGDTSYYSGWFTTDSLSGQKPVFKTIKEGSLIYVESGKDFNKVMPGGLNFILKIDDLKSLLEKLR
ncbi:hypothetical protein V6M85_03025 [Sulfolobus tengchongensis]|uniref:Uncharacterized protein n=1 Tax=Sulfolobus tengchongensis TaxID=207809 RepID=A0AAX4L3U7_9CREN